MTGGNLLITVKRDNTSGYVISYLTREEYKNRTIREKEFSTMLEQAVKGGALKLGGNYILSSEVDERHEPVMLTLVFRSIEVVNHSPTIIGDTE